MPRTIFGDEHELYRTTVRQFLQSEVAPHYPGWEKQGHPGREFWRAAGEAGLLCPTVPEAYGGPDADLRYSAILIEEMGRAGYSIGGVSVHSDIAVPYLVRLGTEDQKRRWLPGCVSGETITAIAMTEPGAGSDLQGIRTFARREGEGYVISGQKTFITNGWLADLVIVVARTDPTAGARGISLLLVEAERAGYRRGRLLEKLGQKAQDTAELFFDDVRVPSTNLLGHEGAGFGYLMQELAQERLVIALGAIAAAEGALEWTLRYAKEREAFGRKVIDFQHSGFALADVATEITIGRVFADHCLGEYLAGQFDATTAAMAKLWLTELQDRVVDACVQLHGGYGYMWEYPIARAYADSRAQRIYGGSSEIMREIIARRLRET